MSILHDLRRFSNLANDERYERDEDLIADIVSAVDDDEEHAVIDAYRAEVVAAVVARFAKVLEPGFRLLQAPDSEVLERARELVAKLGVKS